MEVKRSRANLHGWRAPGRLGRASFPFIASIVFSVSNVRLMGKMKSFSLAVEQGAVRLGRVEKGGGGRERRKLREMNEVPEKFLGHTHWRGVRVRAGRRKRVAARL